MCVCTLCSCGHVAECLSERLLSYLEALELRGGLLVLSEAGVEDEELGVSQPGLQLLYPSLQLLQERVGERREGRARVFHRDAAGRRRPVLLGGAASRMLREDFLQKEREREEEDRWRKRTREERTRSIRILQYQYYIMQSSTSINTHTAINHLPSEMQRSIKGDVMYPTLNCQRQSS